MRLATILSLVLGVVNFSFAQETQPADRRIEQIMAKLDAIAAEVEQLREENLVLRDKLAAMERQKADAENPLFNTKFADREPVFQNWPISVWIKRVADRDDRIRLEAVEALGELSSESPAAVEVLRECLKDKNANIQLAAIRGLWKSSDEERNRITTTIRVLLQSRSSRDRWFGATAYAKLWPPPPQLVPDLERLTDDPDHAVRRESEDALRHFEFYRKLVEGK